jgi:hypothetical protein
VQPGEASAAEVNAPPALGGAGERPALDACDAFEGEGVAKLALPREHDCAVLPGRQTEQRHGGGLAAHHGLQ